MDADGWVGKNMCVSSKLSTVFLNKAFKETKLLWFQREGPCRGKRSETEDKVVSAQNRQSSSV